MTVLILVLLDDALRLIRISAVAEKFGAVLILVLLDDALRQYSTLLRYLSSTYEIPPPISELNYYII